MYDTRSTRCRAHGFPVPRAALALLALALAVTTGIEGVHAQSAQAGKPAAITAMISGSTVSAMVTDPAGSPVANDTPVRFTVPTANGPSTTCVVTSNGRASTSTSGEAGLTVVVTADWNEAGPAATCASVGAQQIHTSVTVGGSGPAPTTGPGTFAAPPVYSSGNPRLAQAVFNGGTLVQLEAAMNGAGAGGAWAQTSTGGFMLYVAGAPAFANSGFTSAFPSGFAGVTALTLVAR